jgi:hypothetical protein
VNPLPELRGQAAVEHLKQEGIYASLAEAVKASLYKAEALPSGDAYRFSNPAQGFRATFTPSGARVASSRGGRELAIKPIAYGYGRRMTRLDSQKIGARGNRIEHEYAPKTSAIRNPQSATQEWFVNTEAGIEHGFTLPERPPAGRNGDEALRVEMEVGGDFEPKEFTYSLKVATRKSKSVLSAGDKPRAATNSAPIAGPSAGQSWRETERKRSKR